MIFPVLELESVVQVNDRTRLDAGKTYISPDEAAITLVEIQPAASEAFIDVTSNRYLDWQYSTDGTAAVVVRVTTDGSPTTFTKDLSVLSVADDKLFSADSELLPYEPNILDYVREGRNSFLDIHRASQDRILKWLDENRYWNKQGEPLTKEDIINLDEVNDWSKFMTLRYIFEGLSNATDDIFHQKSLRYKDLELQARDRARFRVDINGDGDVDNNEFYDFRNIEILRQ